MPFSQLFELIHTHYGTALIFREYMPSAVRRAVHKNFIIATIFLFFLYLLSEAVVKTTFLNFGGGVMSEHFTPRIYGLFLIVFSVAFVFSALEALFRSHYFKGLDTILKESKQKKPIVSWEVATVVADTDEDITEGFCNATYGQEILYRAGVSEKSFEEFEKKRKCVLFRDNFTIESDSVVVLHTYARSIYNQDSIFKEFLSENGINERQFLKAASWVTNIARRDKLKRRWWSRDNLGRIPGLGKTWAYGETYMLEKYGHELNEDPVWQSALMTRRDEDDEVEMLEEVLARGHQTNALVLTNEVLSSRRRVAQFYHKIREGKVLPMLEGRRIFVIDVETIIMATGEKSSFEKAFVAVFNQAVRGGNIILYIENLLASIQSAKVLGTDLVDLMSPYLESPEIQVVVGDIFESYEKGLAHDPRISQAFDVIQLKQVNEEGVFELLSQRASLHEIQHDIVFTVPALEKIGELADRYFPTGVMPDKAFDLLEELVPIVLSRKAGQVLVTDVEELVTKKTHVPAGTPDAKERDKLLQLEEKIHARVIAQDDAITALAKAIRRARSGVGDPKKPMGSFLFLGPTGVGKTETAKALAEVLFDDEEAMIRLDMSEFQTASATADLIGNLVGEGEGRLESLVRMRQYGVLLLDEFEKSHKDVHNIFLQILDEGQYTTGAGKAVNMRNLIIIATSNAGADLIWDLESEGKDVSEMKDVLVNHLIKTKLYRPELLNRFDDIVVFHALKGEHIRDIARIHLHNFAKRIYEDKNVRVEITEELLDFITEKGYDKKFGGRPLERAIKEELGQRIADEILRGSLKAGQVYTFHKDA